MMLAWLSASEIDRVLVGEQRLEQPAVRVEAGRVEHRRLGAEEPRDRVLEVEVQSLRPADEPDRGHPEAPPVEGLVRGGDDVGMIGEPQVVVRAQVHDGAVAGAVELDVWPLRAREDPLALERPRLADRIELGFELRPDVPDHGTSRHESSTLPACPDRTTSNASSCSVAWKRCVITGDTSKPERSITVIMYQVSYISRP